MSFASSKYEGDGDSLDGGDSTSLLGESKDQFDQDGVGSVEQFVSNEDVEQIFSKVQMPSLMLTKLKVKRSKQAVQEAFSVLNRNMV